MYKTPELKARLQSLGVSLPSMDKGRKGGAGPAAGKSLIFSGTVANVPTQSTFVSESPFSILFDDGKYWITEKGNKLVKVTFPKAPHFYEKQTSDGVPMKKIALLHGANCLASTVCQKCVYYGTKNACSFCGIELSLLSGDTIAEKTPEQLSEVAIAAKDEGIVSHVTLTSGTQSGPDKGLGKMVAAANAIKDATGMPVQVQIEPFKDLSLLDDLPSGGVDSIGIHIESLDEGVLALHAPIKAKLGLSSFISMWDKTTEVLGENQVESFVIAGMGEDIRRTLQNMKKMVGAGAYPFIVPLRPIPGTKLQHERPPPPEKMIPYLEKASEIVHDGGLSWKKSKAGCLRCRACSPLPDFEK